MSNDVFANKISKVIKNNEEVYYSKDEKDVISNDESRKIKEKNIYQKLNSIFSSKNYIYKADVIIITKTGEIKKRVIGKNSQYLITMENELIPIVDIIDIKYQ
ncbi:MAG: hypothetical protein IJ565_01350 [Bacilli bacterium]|nr:hypothetical protein [Bacilli bacterium]